MFQPRRSTVSGGQLFAPRPPIQTGEGILSSLIGIFKRSTPFLTRALKSSSRMASKIARSNVVNQVKKGVIDSAVDIGR